MNQKSSTRRNSNKAVLVLATIIPVLIVMCIFQLLSTFLKSDSHKANAQKSSIENDSNENNIQKSETENESDIKYEDGYFYLQNPIQLQNIEGTSIECIYWCENELNILLKQDSFTATEGEISYVCGEILFINKDTRIDKIEICNLFVYRNNYYREENNGLTEDEVFYIDIPKDGETIDVNKEFTKCDLNFKVGKVTRKYNNLIFTFDYDYNLGTISIDIVDDRYLVDGSMCRMNIENQQVLFNSSVGIISDKIKFSIGAISLNLSEILEYE